jgi:signal transduction histidine kinase
LRVANSFSGIRPEKTIQDLVAVPAGHDKDEFAEIVCSANRLILAFRKSLEDRERISDELRAFAEVLDQRVKERTAEATSAKDRAEKALAELQRTQESLIHAEKVSSLAQLVGGIAHEINTPVGVALTAASYFERNTAEINRRFTEGALKKSDLAEYLSSTAEAASFISGNLTRAADLVQSFKRVAVDQTSEKRRDFDLAGYLGEIIQSLRPVLKKLPHAVEIDCPKGIVVDSFPGALFQVMTNFVMNSVEHGFSIEKPGQIHIAVREEGENLRIEYSDDGIGIPRENMKKLFEPFFTTSRGRGGSGLGLHIVYNLVTSVLKGEIRCESEPGAGTRMIVTIPKVVETPPAELPVE